MKKIFEIPELEVVRFVEADIVVCSGCSQEWECTSYGINGGCLGDCSAFCDGYTLNPDLDGQPDNPNQCEEWRSECEGYSAGGFTSLCYPYAVLEDEYGTRWAFEENPAYGCSDYNLGCPSNCGYDSSDLS